MRAIVVKDSNGTLIGLSVVPDDDASDLQKKLNDAAMQVFTVHVWDVEAADDLIFAVGCEAISRCES
jgi:hypothetical protein